MANYTNYNKKDTIKLYKRFFIVLLCCFPVLVMLSIFVMATWNNALQILVYCLIVAAVFILEELLYNAKREQRERLKEEYKKKHGKK